MKPARTFWSALIVFSFIATGVLAERSMFPDFRSSRSHEKFMHIECKDNSFFQGYREANGGLLFELGKKTASERYYILTETWHARYAFYRAPAPDVSPVRVEIEEFYSALPQASMAVNEVVAMGPHELAHDPKSHVVTGFCTYWNRDSSLPSIPVPEDIL